MFVPLKTFPLRSFFGSKPEKSRKEEASQMSFETSSSQLAFPVAVDSTLKTPCSGKHLPIIFPQLSRPTLLSSGVLRRSAGAGQGVRLLDDARMESGSVCSEIHQLG